MKSVPASEQGSSRRSEPRAEPVPTLSGARAGLHVSGHAGSSRQVRTVLTFVLLLLATVPVVAGCSARHSTFEIIDFREGAQTGPFRESFDEAYYDFDALGNIDIVLRRSEPGEADPRLAITQVVHMRAVWRSIPGNTVAHRSQINASVSYAIVHGGVRASFAGAGSVFFSENRGKDAITGTLDQALLKPTRSGPGRTTAGEIFKCADIRGRFHAVRDHRRVVRIVNDMKRLFGGAVTYGSDSL